MKSAIEQAIKEKIKALAKEREITFAELWRNLILERFLTRLARSPYRDKFVLNSTLYIFSPNALIHLLSEAFI